MSKDGEGASSGFRCGHVAIIGRPNTGKSTLLNRLVGQSLAITADRPQTTRHTILGVLSRPDAQIALLDSPGYQTLRPSALNQVLNRTAQGAAQQADVVVLVVEAQRWTPADSRALALVPRGTPIVLALNKLDRLPNPNAVLPMLAQAAQQGEFAALVPISARSGAGINTLIDAVVQNTPEGSPIWPEDTLTDRGERFFAAEFIREKLFRLLGDEIPYQSTVLIDRFLVDENPRGSIRNIDATIVVERRAHKPIILGQGGERIKRIASEARQDMERMFEGKVFLTLWVQVRGGWSKDAAHLRTYGYE